MFTRQASSDKMRDKLEWCVYSEAVIDCLRE